MTALTLREFRNGMSAALNRVDRGESVRFNRRGTTYTITATPREDLIMTPEIKREFEIAREECRRGESVVCKTPEEIKALLASL